MRARSAATHGVALHNLNPGNPLSRAFLGNMLGLKRIIYSRGS
jgi:hypothetical protein